MKRIIICGSRDYENATCIGAVLRGLQVRKPTIITGGAAGADSIADGMATAFGFRTEIYEADWGQFGKMAGPIRNRQMLNTGVDLVIAFKDNFDWSFSHGGTEHMVSIARDRTVPYWVIQGG